MTAAYELSQTKIYLGNASNVVDLSGAISGQVQLNGDVNVTRNRILTPTDSGMTADAVSSGMNAMIDVYRTDDIETILAGTITSPTLMLHRTDATRVIAIEVTVEELPITSDPEGTVMVRLGFLQRGDHVEGGVSSGSTTVGAGQVLIYTDKADPDAITKATSGTVTIPSGGIGVLGTPLLAEA